MEAAVEALRISGILDDAAARCGVDANTMRKWRTTGARAMSDVLADPPRRKLGELTAHERLCADFHERMITAEVEARLYLAGLSQQQAQGGRQFTSTKVKTVNGVEVERVTTTETAHPDSTMLRWIQANRWPEHYGRQRLEVSGPEGGPIPLELRSATDTLLEELSRMAAAEQELGALVRGATVETNGHGADE